MFMEMDGFIDKNRVGIITMHSVLNYGSYLQTFATYKFVEMNGFRPEIVDYRYPNEYHLTNSRNFASRARVVTSGKKNFFYRILSKLGKCLIRPDINKKQKCFFDFYHQYLTFTSPYYTQEELENNPPLFDIYIVGSDQVWNPFFIHHDKAFFLLWAPRGSKKISYGSSMSVRNIPIEFIDDYKSRLQSFSYISVREDSTLLSEILNRKVVSVLDPIFLLNNSEWRKYIEDEPIIKGKYILCYILNYTFNPYPYIYKVIARVQSLLGYKVVLIDGDPAKVFKGYKICTNIGPREFLNLFDNAKFIITTSFHGTAFAINFNKNFLSVIDTGSTDDNRISSLVKKFGLENQCILYKDTPVNQVNIKNIDNTLVSNRLEKLRTESITYFKSALFS